jgi:16S rRNA (cytosine967-C5)-methyltransferase
MHDPRWLAVRILCRAQEGRLPTEPLLGPMLDASGLEGRDRRLVTALVQTVHRWRGRADRVLEKRLTRGVRSVDSITLNILRLGYIQLFHFDQIPPHAVVHTSVDLAWREAGEGKSRLVNRILRGLLAKRPGPEDWGWGRGVEGLEGELSHPAWLLTRWLGRYGETTARQVCEWNNRAPSFHLRVRGGAAAVPEVRRVLTDAGYRVSAGAIVPEALRIEGTLDAHAHPLLLSGMVSIQDESQMLVGHLWPDPEASPVIDLCASPGTKSAHLAERAPEIPVFATDTGLHRARRVRETAARLGLEHLHILVHDARRPAVRAAFRRVLLDAPCSALGVLQRRPDARWLRTPGEVREAAMLQGQILDGAAGLVLPGGWLLYSVCSLEPEETDERIEAFLADHPDFHPDALPGWVPDVLRAGPGVLRVLPGTLGMEGVYAALLRRAEAP